MILLIIGIGGAFAFVYLMWRFAQQDKAALDNVTRILVSWETNGEQYGLAMHGYYKNGVPYFYKDENHDLVYIDVYHDTGVNWEIEVYTKYLPKNKEQRVYIPVPPDVRERVRTVIYQVQKKYGLLDKG